MEVGLIGGGRMAAAISRNLLAAGHQLAIFSPPPGKAQDTVPPGATIAKRLRDACNADVVITVCRTTSGWNRSCWARVVWRPPCLPGRSTSA